MSLCKASAEGLAMIPWDSYQSIAALSPNIPGMDFIILSKHLIK